MKPTASARKLDAYAETRALDRRAIKIALERGIDLQSAYRAALDNLDADRRLVAEQNSLAPGE